jgi:phospholipid/cholesterol/gamma-HCH transport system substrate-binding protein
MGLAVLGTGAGAYILLKQRLPNPFQSYYPVNAAFPSAAAVVPGLGEPVNVAGVRVGEIVGASLKDGQGVLHMQIDPGKLPGNQVYRDAHAELVPNTPLKDMEVNITPGHSSAGVLPRNGVIPVAQTTTPTDADDLLNALDSDTRAWFTSLITELNDATLGRGRDIRALFMNLGPTSAQTRQIGDLLAARRHELSALVHNLGVLTKATAAKDAQLRSAVRAGDQTVRAFADQNVALRTAVARLPGTLDTTRTTLSDVTGFANALGPTATALLPTARRLPATLRQSNTLFRGAALLPLDEIPPFVNAVVPLAQQLPPLTRDLRAAIPALIKSFKVLAYVTNELTYNPGGSNPGFLYWTSWFAHNSDSFISNSDANGSAWRVLVLGTCRGFESFSFGPLIKLLLGNTFGC